MSPIKNLNNFFVCRDFNIFLKQLIEQLKEFLCFWWISLGGLNPPLSPIFMKINGFFSILINCFVFSNSF
jgi:hypothetical protein